jgi:peptidyl serine alpha-galactosyltransferase
MWYGLMLRIQAVSVQAWHLSGDVYSTKAGRKPWISEMYGYSFAAAKHNMWHIIDRVSMIYPGYLPTTPPRLIHYGLNFTIESTEGTYNFDKHWHYQFNPFACRVTEGTATEGGLFPKPPSVNSLLSPPVCAYLCLLTRT